MPIQSIHIQYYKSFKDCTLFLRDINTLLGENGAGKSNFLSAITYFYQNMTQASPRFDIFDVNNPFSNEITLTVTFDLTRFWRIARNKVKASRHVKEDIPYLGYYKKILSLLSDHPDNLLSLTMRQRKNGPVVWSLPYEDRAFLKGLFPVFFLDCRSIDLTDWNSVWDVLGTIASVSNTEKDRILDDLENSLYKDQTEMGRKVSVVQHVLRQTGIVTKETSKDFTIALLSLLLRGRTFQNQAHQFNYFSTGTNSLNYLSLYISSISELSSVKLKEPLILLDEPEISLHHLYIDEFFKMIASNAVGSRFIISTHSARFVRNIIKNGLSDSIYSVKKKDSYSFLQRLRLFDLKQKQRVAATDELANAYFSRAMLLVEGQTERELFSNPYLQLLFPALQKIDIFEASSNDSIKNSILPDRTYEQTPYLMLIDMDKAISYNTKTRHFSAGEYLKGKIPHKKEKFLMDQKHGAYRTDVLSLRKRIFAMTEKCQFHIIGDCYACSDPSFVAYIEAIKKYLSYYHIFVCRTTVEGLLVTKDSLPCVLDFLQARAKPEDSRALERLHALLIARPPLEQENILRLLFEGKSDLIVSLKNTLLPDEDKKLLASLRKKLRLNKTEWISEYLPFYFSTLLGASSNTIRQLQNPPDKAFALARFRDVYPELCKLLDLLSSLPRGIVN